MSKQLATAIHLTDDSGVLHSFLAGSTPPKWARKRITNPKAWSVDEESEDAPDDKPADDSTDSESTEDAGDGSEDSDESGAGDEPDEESEDAPDDKPIVEVPKKNASTKVWAAYAASHGFETDDDVSRAEIIAALEANGIATA